MKALKRCRKNVMANNPDLIDVDTYISNNVIVLDAPETHTRILGGPNEKTRPSKSYIYIDDDDTPNNRNSGPRERNFEKGASSSRRYIPGISPVKNIQGKRTFPGRGYNAHLDSDSSDDDSLDCECMEDPSGEIRKQWERASLKRKGALHNDHNDIGVNKSNQKHDHGLNFTGTRNEKRGKSTVQNDIEDDFSDCDLSDNVDFNNGRKYNGSGSSREFENKQKQAQGSNFNEARYEKMGESSAREDNLSDCEARDIFYGGNDDLPNGEPPVGQDDVAETNEQVPYTNGEMDNEKNDHENGDIMDDDDDDDDEDVPVEDTIIGEREKLKESDEYKRAQEAEMAERERALKIQAEEAQQMRRLLKRKKTESLRILDMERRQKQRVEEIRESQKKDEENMKLKEEYRKEFTQGLKKLEITCLDMASLLRGLGIQVGQGPVALSHEVRVAYKRALLSFHPDHASGSDMRQQVEAEEKFKLIRRMKDKLPM